MFGVLIGLIIWYWQKSTSAEDGALALLDEMAERDAMRRSRPAVSSLTDKPIMSPQDDALPSFLRNRTMATAVVPPVDLTAIHGVGPVFAGRLQAAGIVSIAAVAEMAVARLADVLQISESRAQSIQTAARTASS